MELVIGVDRGEARVFRVGVLLERPHHLRPEGPKAGWGFGEVQPAS